MPKLSRRQTLELGVAAVVIGPSVLFSRTALARPKPGSPAALQAFNFTVGIAGMYDVVPGVVSVDLGSVSFDEPKAPRYSKLKIALDSDADASKLTPLFGKQKVASASNMKISVSLLAGKGDTPAVTYHVIDAVPATMTTNKVGNRLLGFTFGQLERVTHDVPRSRSKMTAELPKDRFDVEVEGVATASAVEVTHRTYDPQTDAFTHAVYAVGAATPKITTTRVSKAEKKRVGRVKFADITVSALVTTNTPGKVFYDWVWGSFALKYARQDGAVHTDDGAVKIVVSAVPAVKDGAVHFLEARPTRVDLPKLEVGSHALVTETFHFKHPWPP